MKTFMKALAVVLLVTFAIPQARAGFSIGDASNYAVLFEGGGNNTLQITNITVNFNVGVGGTGLATDSGPSTINGRIDFSAACSPGPAPDHCQFSNNNSANVISGGVHYNVADVTTALNTVNSQWHI
jgi:hypothetical protein